MIFVRSTLTRTQREDEQQILSMLWHDHIYEELFQNVADNEWEKMRTKAK